MPSSIALRAVAKSPGAFTAQAPRGAAQFTDHERGQGFTFHVFGDHQQRLTCARNLLENWQQILTCC